MFVESYGRSRGPGLVVLAAHRRRARPGQAAAARRRLRRAQRLPHLADVRRPQLAGALHHAVGHQGRRPAALQPARRQRPPHAHARVQARRLAGGRRHAGQPPGVAGGLELLRLRRDLRPPQPRLPRPGLRPAADARPVRAGGPAAPRARRAPPAAAVRRGRPDLEPRAVDAHPAAHPLGRGRRRLDLRPHPARRSPRRRRSSATPSGPAPPTGSRSSTRCARCSRSCSATATTTPCSSCSATTSPRRSSPARAPTTTCRSRSSPTTRRCCDQIAGWGWQDGLLPSPQAPVWPMAAFRDRFLTAFGSPAT